MSRYVHLKLTRAEADLLRLAALYHLEMEESGDGVSGRDRAALERAFAKLDRAMDAVESGDPVTRR